MGPASAERIAQRIRELESVRQTFGARASRGDDDFSIPGHQLAEIANASFLKIRGLTVPTDSPSLFEPALIDRRWYPVDRPEQWAVNTRSKMWDSVRACVEQAIAAAIPLGATPSELKVSDAVFSRLHVCAQSAATALAALGQTDDGAVAMVRAAAISAAAPTALHSAVLGAIEEWCREALEAQARLMSPAALPSVAPFAAVATEWPHPHQGLGNDAAQAVEAFFGKAEGHPVLQATSQLRNRDGVSDIQLHFIAGSRMHVLVLHADVVHGQPVIAVLLHETAAAGPFDH